MKVHMTRGNRFSEAGVVSMLVTVIMMLVISIIVLGFAQISRREQRQSLDRQLSTQAFLAAESGVNDARKAMQDSLRAGGTVPEKTTCATNPSSPYASYNSTIDGNLDVSYTCLLVDTTLDNIRQIVSADGTSVVLPLHPVNGPIRDLQFEWFGDDGATNGGCRNAIGPFDAANNWACDYGMLRMDIVPTDTLRRATLVSGQKTFFFYPTRQGGVPSMPYGTATGTVQRMACTNATSSCRVNITGLPNGTTNYALRLSAIYQQGTVEINGTRQGGAAITFKDAQAQVDVTGRAQDVLRRIQVRLSLGQVTNNADFGLQSGGGICKHFSYTTSDLDFEDTRVEDSTNPMCLP
jgi:hypothetical protein